MEVGVDAAHTRKLDNGNIAIINTNNTKYFFVIAVPF
jgi:hypothetical protein